MYRSYLKSFLAFHHASVECSFVGKSLLFKALVEGFIDVSELVPEREEFLLELGVLPLSEIAEKLFEQSFLLFAEVGDAVELVEVFYVGEHFLCVGEVFVDVVEVFEQNLAPAVELVEGFASSRDVVIDLVEVANEFDGVGHGKRALLSEKVADGGVGRAPDGLSGLLREVLVEEERGSLVGEYDGGLREVRSVFCKDVLGDVL